MKAVILAGGVQATQGPFARAAAPGMAPLGSEPVLARSLARLREAGVTDLILCVDDSHQPLLDWAHAHAARDFHLHVHRETQPRGAAGVLRDVRDILGEGPALVLGADVYVDFDPTVMIHQHFALGSVVTLAAGDSAAGHAPCRAFLSGPQHRIVSLHREYGDEDPTDDRPSLLAWNFMVINPGCLDWVDRRGYQDLKEQWLPPLLDAGMPIHAFVPPGACHKVGDRQSYMHVHAEWMQRQIAGNPGDEGLWPVADGVWAQDGASIPRGVRFIGPVFVYRDARIQPGATLVGPSCIGPRARLSAGASVSASALWAGARVDRDASADNAILAAGAKLPPGRAAVATVVTTPPRPAASGLGQRFRRRWAPRFYRWVKRGLDILGALAGLLLTAPLVPLVALLIKLDSPGPVFFQQRRQTRGGREFSLLKFRTMVANAEAIRQAGVVATETDSPTFKIQYDPRVTRLGAVLRRTNIDEIPQLLNVLAGHMSLVGPRPLADEENRLCREWRDARLSIPPGLTGLWQVKRSTRGRGDFAEWIRYDMEYCRRRSLWLDARILLTTVRMVLRSAWHAVLQHEPLPVDAHFEAAREEADHAESGTDRMAA